MQQITYKLEVFEKGRSKECFIGSMSNKTIGNPESVQHVIDGGSFNPAAIRLCFGSLGLFLEMVQLLIKL